MLVIELACVAIVAAYLAGALRRAADRRGYLRRFAVLAMAAWLAEDSCIRLYGFYSYSPEWFPRIDRTPLLIVLIWPVVILSARELAGCLLHARRLVPLVGGLLVLADASFMEPIAVRAGLWAWTEPGLFGVPPVGLLGWGYFAATCLLVFERVEARAWPRGWDALAILVAPAATHLALLASWWGLCRWISAEVPARAAAVAVWAAALLVVGASLRARARRRVPFAALLGRVPAALFFFVLLALHARSHPALLAWALAFAPPYLSLIDLIRRHGEPRLPA
jgi:hypothetical protein